jgi:hypothetical protein
MKTPREVISETLMNYRRGEEEAKRGVRSRSSWGRDHADWQADAILDALARHGLIVQTNS